MESEEMKQLKRIETWLNIIHSELYIARRDREVEGADSSVAQSWKAVSRESVLSGIAGMLKKLGF
jgi:hypothetical protein